MSEPLLAGGKHPPYIVLAHSPIGSALLRHICAVFVSELHKVVGSLQFLKLWRESQPCHLCDFLLLNSSAFQLSHHAALIFEALAIDATDHSAGQTAICTFRQVFWPWPLSTKNRRCDPKANIPRSQKDYELGAASLWHRLQHGLQGSHFWLKIFLRGPWRRELEQESRQSSLLLQIKLQGAKYMLNTPQKKWVPHGRKLPGCHTTGNSQINVMDILLGLFHNWAMEPREPGPTNSITIHRCSIHPTLLVVYEIISDYHTPMLHVWHAYLHLSRLRGKCW